MNARFPDAGTVRTALTLASRAPSVHNTQPWRWRVDAASLHLYSTYVNATRPHEYQVWNPELLDLFKEPSLPKDGYVTLPTGPGLGLELLQQPQILGLDRDVEGSRRLVGDEDTRMAGDRHRPHHTNVANMDRAAIIETDSWKEIEGLLEP